MSKPPPSFKIGALVRVTVAGRTVDAEVLLAAPNGRSLALAFEAILAGHVGGMPVLWRNGAFRDLMSGQVVTIEKREP